MMKFKKKIVWGIILLILVVVGTLLPILYRQPLGPVLELPTSTQANPKLTTFSLSPTEANSTPTEIRLTATATPQPACGGPAVMNILAVGSDARGDHYLYGLADIIRLVRVDFVNKQVGILEVPGPSLGSS